MKTKKNQTWKPAPTKVNDETAEALCADAIDIERATHGVGRNGRLVQVLKYGVATRRYMVTDQDNTVEMWTAARMRKHFA